LTHGRGGPERRMPKLKRVVDRDDQPFGWMIYCPACKMGHLFDDRWQFNGDMERPTFTPSMLSNGREDAVVNEAVPRCHSYVTDGRIEFLADSTHALAGQTVPLPDIDE
jgi:hypothetical protein